MQKESCSVNVSSLKIFFFQLSGALHFGFSLAVSYNGQNFRKKHVITWTKIYVGISLFWIELLK